MKISDYLLSFDKAEQIKQNDGQAKRKFTMRANRNARWKAAFMQCGNDANARQLATVLDIDDPSSVNQMMRSFIKEGMVEKTREESNGTRTGKRFYYKWIGE